MVVGLILVVIEMELCLWQCCGLLQLWCYSRKIDLYTKYNLKIVCNLINNYHRFDFFINNQLIVENWIETEYNIGSVGLAADYTSITFYCFKYTNNTNYSTLEPSILPTHHPSNHPTYQPTNQPFEVTSTTTSKTETSFHEKLINNLSDTGKWIVIASFGIAIILLGINCYYSEYESDSQGDRIDYLAIIKYFIQVSDLFTDIFFNIMLVLEKRLVVLTYISIILLGISYFGSIIICIVWHKEHVLNLK